MSNDYFESDSQNRPYSVFGNEEPAVIEDPELKQLLPGMELCRKYRLEQKAGSGKMGTVWKSFDLTLNQHVALKFLPPEIRHQEKVIEQVYRAVQAMRVLNHQYICPIYGWENDPRFGSMIVMKWLNGATLEELIKEKQKFRSPFEPEQILTILQKTAEALDHAHKYRIIHQDVRPSNIILKITNSQIEELSLIDFALSAEIHDSSIRFSSAHILTGGTIAYLAPEQWRGQNADAKSDQYSLAILAYELFAGNRPFTAANPELLRLCVLQDTPPQIKTVSESINAALQKALSKNPLERFCSCAEFVKALSEKENINSV
ncbi:MAG: serine/threonine-protein kinase, partial [Planctomycetia bacterium]|nr:serine/threonine-protein kinase [Planctomycetia bacterium]